MKKQRMKRWDYYLTSEEFINVIVKDNINFTNLSTLLHSQSVLICLSVLIGILEK